MRSLLVAVTCLLLAISAGAQQKKQAAASNPDAPAAFEARSNKVWEDFKNRNKQGLEAVATDDFQVLEEDGAGFTAKKAWVAGADDFDMKSYSLTNYTVKMLGNDGALVNYRAQYEGVGGGQAVKSTTEWAEVWVRQRGDWKLKYLQETIVK
jgi:hypothetical protein